MVTGKGRLKAHAGEGASRPMKNYYEILGVAQTSDEETITAAFKALMQKLDSVTDSATAAKGNTKEFNDVYAVLKAYEVLIDPDARREYDAGLAVQFENRPQKLEKKRSVAIARGEALVQAPSAQCVPDGAYESPKSGKNSFIVALLVLVLLVGGSVMLLKADAASCTELFTAENYVAAVEPCTKLANEGDELAQLNLGYMYNMGKGVDEDYAAAVIWYRKAAEQGNLAAKEALAALGED